ncbi:biopolymer transporter ExbB [Haematobacter missouriensis]|uniref:Biopolymer transporter ExbB n=2 Tax=Haematobacter missouriensis TaxID=366616 RepID=A0A212AST7_9RHOB|nr:biopolymer transporter ExbB [Haematobacter missouriensis]OWJ75399.1 biopolymer transporter ExbB [Haematobacter missouriensis]OWJ84560.1 biopolymer transporter ExbB [Haematobacter missouriensis]
MNRPAREVDTVFSQPVRQVLFMVIALLLVAAGAWMIHREVSEVFRANVWLNGSILFVFLVGVVACFWQVGQLMAAVNWIEGFAHNRPGYVASRPPKLLVPLATLLGQRTPGAGRLQLSSTSARSILESVGARMEEMRDITRYLGNLLIFLGLLGTFFGLATTVPAVVRTIGALSPQPGEESLAVFGRLMQGLNSQLGGMGTAFASSLLGLSGSLVIGLLEIFASHGQNRFYSELEDWLSSMTRIGIASGDDGSISQEAVGGLIDHLSDQMDALTQLYAQAEQRRSLLDQRIGLLAESVDRLTRKLEGEAGTMGALTRLTEGQERLVGALAQREETGALDAESRMRLRSMDVQLLKILEELSAGRQETLYDLRSDLAALASAVRGLGSDQRRG